MKEFKSLEEQIELLKQRGLIIPDEERAKKYLLSQTTITLSMDSPDFFLEKEIITLLKQVLTKLLAYMSLNVNSSRYCF